MNKLGDKFIPLPSEEIQEEVVQRLPSNLENYSSLCAIPSAEATWDTHTYERTMNCVAVDCRDCWFYFKHKHQFIKLILGERNGD